MTWTSRRYFQRIHAVSNLSRSFRSIVILLTQVAGLIGLVGCACQRTQWRAPAYAAPYYVPADDCDGQANVEQLYAQALELQMEDCGACVDLFFEVAVLTSHSERNHQPNSRNRQLHDSALRQMIAEGEKFNRIHPSNGLTVYRQGAEQLIPFRYHGFVWESKDFQQFIPVGDYQSKSLSRSYRCPGIGVPLVVTGRPAKEDRFYPTQIAFSATMRLNVKPCDCQAGLEPSLADCQLELYDPFRVDTVLIEEQRLPIAKDLTAPIAYRLRNRRSNILSGFVTPGNASPDTGSTEGNLYTLEPYQPGKVPVVLIHGLLADPFTWAEVVNELRARTGFVDRFQLWVFEYPTGSPFLSSAAELRELLEQATQEFDPRRSDRELSNMILVGHSMGGLIAKLQVTSSGDRLWRAVANRPLDQISAPNDYRELIRSSFYFQPSPYVSRVVFIATPHRGSAFATRLVGRIGSSFVSEPELRRRRHRNLINNNPGVFSKQVSRRVPTSIDLLEPQSRLLQTIDKLPVRCGVALHSVIGDRCCSISLGRSDGVVPVANARERRAISELKVSAKHTGTKEHPKAIQELLRVLDLHLQHSCQQCVQPIAAIAD